MVNKSVQKMISVASIAAPKLDVYSIVNDGEYLHVHDAFIIRLLSQILQLPYKILLTSDDEFGAKLPDGNWTGVIGMVHRSEADIAIGVRMSYLRFQDGKFSYPYLFSDMTFATDKPKPDPTSFAIMHPFPLTLWILIITTLFIFSCVLFVHVYRKQTFQDILFMLFGSLLEKSIGMQLRKKSLKMIISTWFIFIFVIINSYKAVLLSFLILPPLTGIRNIPDLAKAAEQNSITCYSYKGSGLYEILLESEFITWRSIGKCIQRNVGNSEDKETFFMKASPKKSYLASRSFILQYEEKYFISKDSFFNTMIAFPVSKKFPHLNYLNKMIHRLFAAGIFQKIEKDKQFIHKLNATSSESSEPNGHKILQLADIKGAFVVVFSGYALSTAVLLIEIAIKRYFPNSNVTLKAKGMKISRKNKRKTNVL